jgi:hypothetical protein
VHRAKVVVEQVDVAAGDLQRGRAVAKNPLKREDVAAVPSRPHPWGTDRPGTTQTPFRTPADRRGVMVAGDRMYDDLERPRPVDLGLHVRSTPDFDVQFATVRLISTPGHRSGFVVLEH